MLKISRSFIIWVSAAIASYLVLGFLISKLGIFDAILIVLTLGYIFILIPNLLISSPQFVKVSPRKAFDWDSVDVWNPYNQEHQCNGMSIVRLCKSIITHFGSKSESKYEDEFITIIESQGAFNKTASRIDYVVPILRLSLSSSNEVVLVATDTVSRDYEHLPVDISVFRPGSWITHVEAFRSEINQIEAKAQEDRQQAFLRKQKEKFGRID